MVQPVAMELLIIAVLVLAQHPATAPEGKGAPKGQNPNSTQTAKPTQADNRALQQSGPVPSQLPVVATSTGTSSALSDVTSANNHQANEQDRAIQRKLVLFAGALAGFGFLQLVVMFLQWRIYKRQAREMRRQRHEMRRQRHVMFGQYKAMRSQITPMEGAGKQTAELIRQAST